MHRVLIFLVPLVVLMLSHACLAQTPEQEAVLRQGQQLEREGMQLFAAGDFAGAVRVYRRLLTTCPGDPPVSVPHCIVVSQIGLGLAHTKLSGDVEAEAAFRAALDVAQAQLPFGNMRQGEALLRLGEYLFTRKRFAEAEPLLREAMGYVPSHPNKRVLNEAFVAGYLANSLRSQGKFVEALPFAEAAVLTARELPWMGKSALSSLLVTWGLSAQGAGQLGDAEKALREALTLIDESTDRRFERAADIRFYLGEVLREMVRWPQAEKLYREALDIRLALHGEAHLQVAVLLERLAAAASQRGDYRAAEAAATRARAILVRIGQTDNAVARGLETTMADFRRRASGAGGSVKPLPEVASSEDKARRAVDLTLAFNAAIAASQPTQALAIGRERLALALASHGEESREVAWTRHDLVGFLVQRAAFAEAEKLAVASLRAAQERNYTDLLPKAHSALGLVRGEQGRLAEAEAALRAAVEIGTRQGDTKSMQAAAQALGNLGSVLRRQGRYGEAITVGEQALDRSRAVWGEGHPITAGDMHILANAYALANRQTEAARLRRQALDIRLQELGERNFYSIISLGTVSGDLLRAGKLAQADAMANRAVAAAEALYGPNQPTGTGALGALADVRIAQGRLTEARALVERGQALGRRTRGNESPGVTGGEMVLAQLARGSGKFEEAERLGRAALAAARRLYAADHPFLADFETGLALTLIERGGIVEARQLLALSITQKTKAYGGETPAVTTELLAQARIARLEGDVEQAITLSERSLALLEQSGQGDEPAGAAVRLLLAHVLMARDLVGAEAQASRALRTLESTYGPKAFRTGEALRTVAAIWLAQGKFAEAGKLAERALAISRAPGGTDSGADVASMELMTRLFHSTGHLSEAEQQARAALTAARKRFGPGNVAIAGYQSALARVLIDRGLLVEAKRLLRETIALTSKARGSESWAQSADILALSRIAWLEGNAAETAALAQRAMGLLDRAGLGDRPYAALSRAGLAYALLVEGRMADAAAAIARARPILEATAWNQTPAMIQVLRIAAAVAVTQDQFDAAAADIDRALELGRRLGRGESLEYSASLSDRGLISARQGQHADAARYYRDAIALLERFGAARHPVTAITLANLAISLDALGGKVEAEAARAKARDILKGYQFIVKPPERWI